MLPTLASPKIHRRNRGHHPWWLEISLLAAAFAIGTLALDQAGLPDVPSPRNATNATFTAAAAPAFVAGAIDAVNSVLPDNNVIALILCGTLIWCISLRRGVRKQTIELDRQRAELEAAVAERTAELRRAHAEVAAYNSNLERLVAARTAEVTAVQDTAVFALAKLADSRDSETGQHLLRIRAFSQIIAEELAANSPYADEIDQQFLDDLFRSTPLHDIGKVGIADAVLCKSGKLTAEEFEIMKRHTIIGANALDQVMFNSDHGSFLAMASVIARFHHERFDGSGYFAGLKGQEIPLPARIVAVADVYDALTSKRTYKDAFDTHASRDMIVGEKGKHFDPVIVDAFLRRFDDILAAQLAVQSTAPCAVGAAALLGDLLQPALAVESV